MSSQLPKFQKRPAAYARGFMVRALGADRLRDIIAYDDGHFRAVFDKGYFTFHEGATEPTKSQWSTFKKHLKRIDSNLFVFKQHGEVACGDEQCYYVDFGFFDQ